MGMVAFFPWLMVRERLGLSNTCPQTGSPRHLGARAGVEQT